MPLESKRYRTGSAVSSVHELGPEGTRMGGCYEIEVVRRSEGRGVSTTLGVRDMV